jgi:predicted metal-dependent hydrolase
MAPVSPWRGVVASERLHRFHWSVQFDFFPKRPTSKPTDSIVVGDQNVPLLFVVNPRSKRYLLRLKPDGSARVTIPRRGSFKAAREFVQRNAGWIKQQLQRIASRPKEDRAWRKGSRILFRGEEAEIRGEDDCITFGGERITIGEDVQDLRPAIERHMRSIAAAELPPRVSQLAQQHGLAVQRVSVRNQKSRWGSCSPRGTVSLNWRLIQAPGFVADYIILHELMHVRQMNHSRKFWHEVESVCLGFTEAEKWLKQHTSLLRF